MIVISDTSVLNYAIQIEVGYLLPVLFGGIIIPVAVYAELQRAKDSRHEALLNAPWLQRAQVHNRALLEPFLRIPLGLGEAEAIVLYQELKADALLIDESRGRREARKNAVRIIGLLGVLTLAKKEGLIAAVKPFIERLISETDFRCSESLIRQVLTIAHEQ